MAGTTVVESGTFTLTGLVAFQFMVVARVTVDGTRIPLPSDFCGGRVMLASHATSSTGEQRDVLVEVNCQIHDHTRETKM
jgi:hypothetical protein